MGSGREKRQRGNYSNLYVLDHASAHEDTMDASVDTVVCVYRLKECRTCLHKDTDHALIVSIALQDLKFGKRVKRIFKILIALNSLCTEGFKKDSS